MGVAYQGDCSKLTVLHLCIYLLVVVGGGAHRKAGTCFWRSEDTLKGLVLSTVGIPRMELRASGLAARASTS